MVPPTVSLFIIILDKVNASAEDLAQVRLRVGGRALRWDALDEDIWIYDAVVGRYPVAVAS
jgi:hypothetical protein